MENIQNRLEVIEALIRKQSVFSKEVLTLEEGAEFLELSKSALYKMTSKREIPFYCPGGKKIYFRRAELESWVFNGKVASAGELDQEVNEYLCRTSKS